MKQYIFVVALLCSRLILAKEKCRFVNKSTNETEWRCCDNWEDRDGTCVECSFGYQSLFGEKCKRCDGQSYGRKCGYTCMCEEYQRCDHVSGCTNITTPSLTSVSAQEVIDQVFFTLSGKVDVTDKQDVTEKPEIALPGFLRKEIELYLLCTSMLALVFVLGILFLKQCRKRMHVYSGVHHTLPTVEHHETNEDDTSDERIEGIYETIDESNLVDLSIQSSDSDSDKSSASSYVSPLAGNGYTNPYQPAVADPAPHEYCLTHTLSRDSGSSNDFSSGYLHPYQTIVTDISVHDYNLLVNTSGCSNSMNNEKFKHSFILNQVSINIPIWARTDCKLYLSLPDLKTDMEKTNHPLTNSKSDTDISREQNLSKWDAPSYHHAAIINSHMTDNTALRNLAISGNLSDNIPYIQMGDLINGNVL